MRPVKESNWKIGRVVECTGLENQQRVKPFEGSNPSSSAIVWRVHEITRKIDCENG
tara:strand:- start:124 stop:291 length:168 start_codon:yes stop_codon:yes gene_type:complete